MRGAFAARTPAGATSVADALASVLPNLPIVRDAESVPLLGANSRVLAEPIVAPMDLPKTDFSAMDGYAVRTADLSAGSPRLTIIGTATAGHPFDGGVGPGQTVRILTGAVLPDGCDCVVPQEQCDLDGVTVRVDLSTVTKSHRRIRGEDVAAGATVFGKGHRLRALDLVVAAALGIETVEAWRPLRVGVFSSGDELRSPGAPLLPGQIWDVNGTLLSRLLAALGCDVRNYGIVPDDAAAVEGRLLNAARDCDLLVTTGGVSVGSEDHMRSVIGRRGVLEVWPLAIKPGKPVGFGDIDDCPIVALPGNPVAALVAFVAFARPIVNALSGIEGQEALGVRLPAGFATEKQYGIRQYVLAELAVNSAGLTVILPTPRQSPAQLSPLAQAKGFAVLPEEMRAVIPGTPLDFIGFDTLLF